MNFGVKPNIQIVPISITFVAYSVHVNVKNFWHKMPKKWKIRILWSSILTSQSIMINQISSGCWIYNDYIKNRL